MGEHLGKGIAGGGVIAGSIALGPLAMTCLANDVEIPIDTESEYLLKELLQFGWLGKVDA